MGQAVFVARRRREVALATRRDGDRATVSRAQMVMESLELIELTPELADRAGRLSSLRALDAIHLASALSLGDAFVAYDRRLHDAAAAAGLRVLAPA